MPTRATIQSNGTVTVNGNYQSNIATGNIIFSNPLNINTVTDFALSALSNNNTIQISDGNGGYITLTANQARAILADSSLNSQDSDLNIEIAQQGNTDIDSYIESTHFGERFRAEYLADNAEKTIQDGIDQERFNPARDAQRHRNMQKSIDMGAVEDSQAQNNSKQAALLLAYFEQQYLQTAALEAEQNRGSSIEAGGNIIISGESVRGAAGSLEAGGDLIIEANVVDFANVNLSANGTGGINIFGANAVNIGAQQSSRLCLPTSRIRSNNKCNKFFRHR